MFSQIKNCDPLRGSQSTRELFKILHIWVYRRTFRKSVTQNDVIQAFWEDVAVMVERFREIFGDYVGILLAYRSCREDVNLFRFQLSPYMKWRELHLYIIDGRRSITKHENPSSTIFKH
jgi:hypothetical protein